MGCGQQVSSRMVTGERAMAGQPLVTVAAEEVGHSDRGSVGADGGVMARPGFASSMEMGELQWS